MPKHLIIYQSSLLGHRPEYVMHILNYLKNEQVEICVWIKNGQMEDATNTFRGHPNVIDVRVGELSENHLSSLGNNATRLVVLDGDTEQLWLFKNRKALRQIQVEVLMMRMFRPLSMFSFRSWAALAIKTISTLLFPLFLNIRFSRIAFLESKNRGILNSVRDPLTGPRLTAENRPGGDGIFRVGIIGTLEARKSVDLAIEMSGGFDSSTKLFLVGKVVQEFESTINDKLIQYPNVFLLNKKLTEEEFNSWSKKMDCLLFLQKTNAPSGTLLRALALSKSCVVGGSPLLQRAAIIFPNQVQKVELNSISILAAIQKFKSTYQSGEPSTAHFDFPSPDDFASDLLGKRMNSESSK